MYVKMVSAITISVQLFSLFITTFGEPHITTTTSFVPLKQNEISKSTARFRPDVETFRYGDEQNKFALSPSQNDLLGLINDRKRYKKKKGDIWSMSSTKYGFDECSSNELLTLLSERSSDEISADTAQKESADQRVSQIQDSILSLESSFAKKLVDDGSNIEETDDLSRFDPLIGLYQVKYVLQQEKDNPAGGRWTRKSGMAQSLFQTRNLFQHLVPFNATGLAWLLSHDAEYREKKEAKSIADAKAEKVVAEAINVVSLDAFNKYFRVTVILRGDAVPLSPEERGIHDNSNSYSNSNATSSMIKKVGNKPTRLSNLAVRAYFDPPRIYFGRRCRRRSIAGEKSGVGSQLTTEYKYIPLIIGPPSSVVLDTTYYDKKIRIGMGGSSGARFVFSRCGNVLQEKEIDTQKELVSKTRNGKADQSDIMRIEAMEYEALLAQPLAKKSKVICGLAGIAVTTSYLALGDLQFFVTAFVKMNNIISRFLGGALSSSLRANLSALLVKINVLSFASIDISKSVFLQKSTQLVAKWSWKGVRGLCGMTSLVVASILAAILFSNGGIERDYFR